jgi:cytochrome b pre-mRNA-processing protein 3
MIFRLFRSSPRKADKIESLYGAIVAQGRAAAFYQDYGVPDTVNGRFEMLVLHAVLLLRRLNGEKASLRALGQAVFDKFCNDMDANLRELGAGDLSVPKKMRRIGEAFYGRQSVYGAALDGSDPSALSVALGRNVFSAAAPDWRSERLAAYVREAARRLSALDRDAFGSGQIAFPLPETVILPRLRRRDRRSSK